MLKKSIFICVLIISFLSCIQTPANLKDKNGQFISRNGQINIHHDALAKELFYPSLKYLADDLGANIVHSSKTRLSMRGKLANGYAISIKITQRLDNVCEIRIYSSKHGRPDDALSEQVATGLLSKLM